jgi:hypothetical protein
VRSIATLIPLALALSVNAQSINIDFGVPGSAPAATYAAAGLAGTWNSVPFVPASQHTPLVGLYGQTLPVTIYHLGGASILFHDNPATLGDDAALMDDMFISLNNPVDLCLYFQNLQNGVYDVIVYGMDPDNAAGQNRIRVDNSTPGPTWIGGAWPGNHQQGITYSKHTVTITNGRVFPHAGELGANYRSGINGLQLVLQGECWANCDGSGGSPLLTANDFQCFINRFANNSPLANCDHSEGSPALTPNDFTCFLNAYIAGCPD